MKRCTLGTLLCGTLLGLVASACGSDALSNEPEPPAASAGAAGASAAPPAVPVTCQAALRQALLPIDMVSPGEVTLLSQSGSEKSLFADGSAGGLGGKERHPWLYLNLAAGSRAELTDEAALFSTEWDLAIERAAIRTNSGVSGPGAGGTAFVAADFERVTPSVAQGLEFRVEDWFDDDCTLQSDATGEILTTFAGWNGYDEATHVLAPLPGTYLVRGGRGRLYKVAILDYYANADGSHGMTAGRYRLRVAALE